MTQPTLESLFGGGGGKSISWKDKPLGTVAGGTIKVVNPPHQVTDLVTKELKFKKDKVTPLMAVRIDLATNERDPQDPEDDGTRSLYAQGWMFGAIGDAMRKAGAEGTPQPGAQLWVTLTERTPPETPGLNPTNKFSAVYFPPVAAATSQLFQQPAPQGPVYQQTVAPPTPQYAPAQQPVYVPPQVAPAPGGYAAPPPGYAQQPPVQPAVEPEPARPPQIAEGAWAAMPLDVKKSVAATMAVMPGSVQSPGAPPF